MKSKEEINYDNYNSHHWRTDRYDVPTHGTEYVTTCYECGIENMGDPVEFPELEYPSCKDC